MTTYDENIQENVLHKFLVNHHPDLLEKISNEKWIVCLPRNDAIQNPVSNEDLYDHILVISETTSLVNTLNKTSVKINNDSLIIGNNVIGILFKETVYLKQLKYLVYCVEYPLNSRVFIGANLNNTINNLRDCIDFLCTETEGRDILLKLNDVCEGFLLEHENIVNYSLDELKLCLSSLYEKCLEIPLEYNHLRERTEKNPLIINKLRLSIESYMQNRLNNQIFYTVCTITSNRDASFNKIIRNLQNVHCKHFEISKFNDCIASARCELNKLNHYITTLGKINCLKSTFDLFSNNNKHNLTSEDLLHLFSFLIIKLNVNNWIGNLVYLQHFTFSRCNNYDENNFILTTLEATLEYIKSGILFETSCDIDTSQNELFRNIQLGNLEAVKSLLKETKREIKLCHPLCSCDNCEQKLMETNESTIYLKDINARNCLHIACIYGFPHIVDYFLNKSIQIDEVDFSGSSPIHYAASHGNQNALLLLLHNGSNMNIANGDGNTPLHLASNNGHENCVKALLYYSEHKNNTININAVNTFGNTALHLSAKWGYVNILTILLQHNIDFTIKNKQNQKAIDLAHNYYVKKLLLSCTQPQTADVSLQYTAAVEESVDFSSHDKQTQNSFGIRPKTMEQFKKTDLLLKSIENNDLPMSCFYLGIPVTPITTLNPIYCHPLCSCDNCNNDYETQDETVTNIETLNVNICNCEGYTPLHVAAKYGRKEILRLLLDAEANVNLRTYKALYTPLHVACINQRVSVVKELLQCGGNNIDSQDSRGNTALHYACFKNDARIVNILLGEGASVDVRNCVGKTALQEAQEQALFSIVKLIKNNKRNFIVMEADEFMYDL